MTIDSLSKNLAAVRASGVLSDFGLVLEEERRLLKLDQR